MLNSYEFHTYILWYTTLEVVINFTMLYVVE